MDVEPRRASGKALVWIAVITGLFALAIAGALVVAGSLREVRRTQFTRNEPRRQAASRAVRAADDACLRMRLKCVEAAIDTLRGFERFPELMARIRAKGAAPQLAEWLSGADHAGEDPERLPRADARGHLLWDGDDASFRRVSGAGAPGTTWAGEWMILVVGTRHDGSVRSAITFTDRHDSFWVREGAADIDEVVASAGTSSVADALPGMGWRVLPDLATIYEEAGRDWERAFSGETASPR